MPTNQQSKSSGRRSQAQPSRESTFSGNAGEIMHDVRDQASDYWSRGTSRVREMTDDREGTAVVVALTAGFGVGLLIGAALASSHSKPKSWRDRIAYEGLGRRVLDRIEQILPDAVTDYVHR